MPVRTIAGAGSKPALIMKTAELGTKMLDNRIDGFLKSKDVLTIDQKKLLCTHS